jgi:predicted NBD/HSP70 family sugar kinase
MKILVLDVGGTHVKMRLGRKVARFASGESMTPVHMVKEIAPLFPRGAFDAVSIGYPGLVVRGRIVAEPRHLGRGWVRFDFRKAFGCPVKIVNDAAMQALGSYRGGRMLFLGLGTGLGSCLILDGEIEPMELAHLPYRKGRTYEEVIGVRGLKQLGKKKWRRRVAEVVRELRAALEPDYVVIGGGNARKLGRLPKGVQFGDNANAFTGGLRLWRSGPSTRTRN